MIRWFKTYTPLVVVIIGAFIFRAVADNYALTQGSGTTFGSHVIATVNYPENLICDGAVGTTCATVTAGNALKVDGSAVTQPVSGTVTANLGTIGLAATASNQATGNTTLANIQTAVQSPVPLPSASGGWTYKLLNGTTNSGVSVKPSPGTLAMLHCYNPNASVAYIQLYDTAGTVTVGTGIKLSFGVPATNSTGFSLPVNGIQFTAGIAVAATTSASGSTAPTTALDCNAAFN